MKIIAHRGYSSLYPENTMLAFEKAYEAGCDGIELDVQLTKDNIMVIIHDETINRTSNGTGFVKNYTYKELLQFDFSSFFAGKYQINYIPTLLQYLEWVKNKKIFTNIELKNNLYYYTHLEDRVAEAIRKYNLESKVVLSSFNNVSVLKCKRLLPKVKTAFLLEQNIGNPGQYVKENSIDAYNPNIKFLTQEDVINCKEHKIEINVWTINTKKTIEKMLEWNVDGIFTNDPPLCKKVMKGL